MPIAELACIPPPLCPREVGDESKWEAVQQALGCRLPHDLYSFGMSYGRGYFKTPGGLLVFVWNPFSPDYHSTVRQNCFLLRAHLTLSLHKNNTTYGVYPTQPGWLPWGNDIDGSLLCWLTEGEPDEWPIILLSPERTSFQQIHLPMTTFLARAFTRRIELILWNDPSFFSGPEPVRFVLRG